MSLPAKYQEHIIDKIINDFPELIFNKNQEILNNDVYFETYIKIIKQGSKIDEEIKKFNETFKLPYDKLISFNTGKMIIDIDGLISESYKKMLKLKEHRDKLIAQIKYLEDLNKKLENNIFQKNEHIKNISSKLGTCQSKKEEALKTIEDDKKIKQSLEQKCAQIQKQYEQEVKKNEILTTKSKKKILVNKKKLLVIREKLSKIDQKLDNYNNNIQNTKKTNSSNNISNINNSLNNFSEESNNNDLKEKKEKKEKKKEKKEKNISAKNFDLFYNF